MSTDSVYKMHLELFMFRVEQMRQAQKEYFVTRSGSSLNKSKLLEKQVDNALQKLMGMGYTTEEIKKVEQSKMF